MAELRGGHPFVFRDADGADRRSPIHTHPQFLTSCPSVRAERTASAVFEKRCRVPLRREGAQVPFHP